MTARTVRRSLKTGTMMESRWAGDATGNGYYTEPRACESTIGTSLLLVPDAFDQGV